MPYVKPEVKDALILESEDLGEVLDFQGITNPGELNFAITYIIKNYIDGKGLTYQHLNDVLGALEGAKLEFYRRVVMPYEINKIKENGDVYE